MSNSLAALDLSELPEPYLRRLSSPQHQQQTHMSTASAKPTSTSAFNYQTFTPATPASLDAWIRAPSSNPNDLFSSFLQPTPRTHPDHPSVSDPPLQIHRSISLNHLSPPPPPPPPSVSLHTTTQPDRMIYTAPLRPNPPAHTLPIPTQSPPPPPPPCASVPQPTSAHAPPLATPLITPMFSTPSDGLSAVERAKKTADQFTMSQLAKKRKAAGLHPDPKRARNISSSKSSTDDDDKNEQNLPEKISHRKYQKRLQKNRDSAFVSRIRRREYTRLLEESLATTEKEKDAAVNSFLEMKRRFDIVSAELNAFKQAAASNLSAVRESLFSHLSTTTTDTQPVRSGTVVTSMFMVTLLFGILLPECIRQRFGLHGYSPDSHLPWHGALPEVDSTHHSGIRSMLFGNMFSQDSHNVSESRGKVWGQSARTVYLDEQLDQTDKSWHDDTLKAIQTSSLELLGAEHSESFLKLTKLCLEGLSSEQFARLDDVFRYGNSTHFEQLVEIEALARKIGRQRPSESDSLLEHVTLQMENARL